MSTNTLIALVDGSAYSESVCHHAAWIAGKNDWKVKIYHVMGRRDRIESQDLSGAIRLGARTALLAQLTELDEARAKLAHEHGRAILDDARTIVEGDGAIEVETRLRQGDLVETVTAKEESGEMVVIGKRGEAAALAMEHLGSNLERIVRASHRPVFIANRAFKPIDKVLVAFDGGTSSLKAVDYIARSELFVGLRVTLVFAGKDTPEMRKALEDAHATLKAGGSDVDIEIRSGDPEAVLGEIIIEGAHGLLVMGAYGHSRVRNLVIGSTTTEMLRSCRVPVLIMR
ncbi:nucleotide-binding universal stress UspA family protein [Roseovarius halotolerans]|uniref:Universal stress protein family protein n=1 Tax=Roseovarius halotolerans TaxID=505353 RepID=A0A1X6YA40_9RHOB|nr:universal stress protein [Roseovarius halotolerans]RKT35013.1 nucleotide-binding universal stress UspA family protein [Roseovarius halotolerans]SLN15119.1 Universal stress protein family protein [Roseovarius halotolerans]